VSKTDAGSEFHVDGAAVLKARLANDILLNGVCSSGMDNERSDPVSLRARIMWGLLNIESLNDDWFEFDYAFFSTGYIFLIDLYAAWKWIKSYELCTHSFAYSRTAGSSP